MSGSERKRKNERKNDQRRQQEQEQEEEIPIKQPRAFGGALMLLVPRLPKIALSHRSARSFLHSFHSFIPSLLLLALVVVVVVQDALASIMASHLDQPALEASSAPSLMTHSFVTSTTTTTTDDDDQLPPTPTATPTPTLTASAGAGAPTNLALFEHSSVPKIRRAFESRSASVAESKERERLLHEQAAKRRQLNLHTGRALSDAAALAVSVPLSPADLSRQHPPPHASSSSSPDDAAAVASASASATERKLRDTLRSLWESLSCVCCYQSLSCIVTLPCAHMCLCQFCCAKVDSCPLCRVKIESSMLVHCQWDALKLNIDFDL